MRTQESMAMIHWRAEVMRSSSDAVSSAMLASELVLVTYEVAENGWTHV